MDMYTTTYLVSVAVRGKEEENGNNRKERREEKRKKGCAMKTQTRTKKTKSSDKAYRRNDVLEDRNTSPKKKIEQQERFEWRCKK
ncbi:hypothetical protein ACSS6W_004004 [Trichoderma asperelloides]